MPRWCDNKLAAWVGGGIVLLTAVKLLAEIVLVQYLVQLSQALKQSGAFGQLIFVACTDVWIVLMLPTTPLELMTAFSVGFRHGLALNLAAKWTGSII